ncbi:MAG: hypothetical protein JXJ19_02815 [Elusimicrobia bacterium]|nr:hypothetical protein [Elusimicrobiota bacterium]
MIKKTAVFKILLPFISVIFVLGLLELTFRPLAYREAQGKTTIYMKDNDLGWKLRPDAYDISGSFVVRVNSKGLRGPELDYRKPAGTKRILFLGDSVTFGYNLEKDEDTFPYIVEKILKDERGLDIQAVNSGVGGYSPWQEYIYLQKEGLKYDPDLVVLTFVLNDVTEKFILKRFGGTGMASEGWQLFQTASGKSGIRYLTRKLAERLKYGKDVKEGAREKEIYDSITMIYEPDKPWFRNAWKITLGNLSKIVELCRDKDIPLLLVITPYNHQFENIKDYSAPQEKLRLFAIENNVPFLDMLPVLDETAKRNNISPMGYYLDYSHLSASGSRVVAEAISGFILEKKLLKE